MLPSTNTDIVPQFPGKYCCHLVHISYVSTACLLLGGHHPPENASHLAHNFLTSTLLFKHRSTDAKHSALALFLSSSPLTKLCSCILSVHYPPSLQRRSILFGADTKACAPISSVGRKYICSSNASSVSYIALETANVPVLSTLTDATSPHNKGVFIVVV